jgi:hypothetical protein
MKQGKLLAFFSQALPDRGRLKPAYQRELMALLVGELFISYTPTMKSLNYLQETRLLGDKVVGI